MRPQWKANIPWILAFTLLLTLFSGSLTFLCRHALDRWEKTSG